MTDLKQAIIETLRSPQRQLQRQDQLLEEVFEIPLKGEEYSKIAALWKLVGSRVSELDPKSAQAITNLISMLQFEADPSISEKIQLEFEVDDELVDQDKEWNEVILRVLEKKLREAYITLGPAPTIQDSQEIQRMLAGVKAYGEIEEIERPHRERQYREEINKALGVK